MAKPWQRPRNTQSDDHQQQQQQPKFNRAEYLASQNNQKPTVEAEIEETSVVDKVVPKIFPQKEKKSKVTVKPKSKNKISKEKNYFDKTEVSISPIYTPMGNKR